MSIDRAGGLEQGIRFPEAGVTGGCEWPDRDA